MKMPLKSWSAASPAGMVGRENPAPQRNKTKALSEPRSTKPKRRTTAQRTKLEISGKARIAGAAEI
jgi:hypothetical protein